MGERRWRAGPDREHDPTGLGDLPPRPGHPAHTRSGHQVDWRFPSEGHPWGGISDCYALNVDGEMAWTCYYTDFPLLRIDNNVMTGWRNTLSSGVKVVVVGERKVGLFGGYGPERDRVVVASLGEGELTALAEYRLVQPDGSPLPAARRVARGPDLHLMAGPRWYRLSLGDLS